VGISVTAGQEAGGAVGAEHLADPAAAVTSLYREHALGLTRLALVMVGDRQAAEDIVQEAFAGLHRRWSGLRDQD
jgi:DNA-directed RNA polymerase specialized sigma24 family protein